VVRDTWFVVRGTWLVNFVTLAKATQFVTPAYAGDQTVSYFVILDSGCHRNDEVAVFTGMTE